MSLRWLLVLAAGLSVCVGLIFLMRHQPSSVPAAEVEDAARPGSAPVYRPPAARAARVTGTITGPSGKAAPPFPFALLLSPSATNYMNSMRTLQDLPAVLRPAHVDRLRDVMAIPYDPRMPVSLLEFNGVKNAAGEALLQQPEFPSDLAFDFAAMFGDASYDDVWRDYSLQMLGESYGRLSGRADLGSEGSRALAVAVLRGATESHGNTWPGTALLALSRIADSGNSDVSPGEVAERILAVASDASASEAARITALRLAGQCRVADARPAARELAQTGETGTLRAAAIVTLGELGNASDRELLSSLAAETDPSVSAAAKRAYAALVKSFPSGSKAGD